MLNREKIQKESMKNNDLSEFEALMIEISKLPLDKQMRVCDFAQGVIAANSYSKKVS